MKARHPVSALALVVTHNKCQDMLRWTGSTALIVDAVLILNPVIIVMKFLVMEHDAHMSTEFKSASAKHHHYIKK